MEHIILPILALCIPLAAVIGTFAVGALAVVKRSARHGDEEEETRMIQEIYHGLRRMEERVESLETILLDKPGKERKS